MLKSSKPTTVPWLKISFILAFLGLINCLLWGSNVLAQEESTKSSQKDHIRQEVEAIVKGTKQSSLTDELEVKRAFCGNLKSRDLETNILIVETKKEERTVIYDDETIFVDISRNKIKADDLELGSFVTAMGYVNRLSPGSLTAKRVVVQETPAPIAQQSFFGEIDDISKEEKVFVFVPKKGQMVLEVIADEVTIEKRENEKTKKAQFSDIVKGDKVILVGERDKNDSRIKAALIYVLSSVE